jgi:hypothetical protein
VMPAGWIASLAILALLCVAVIARNAPAQQAKPESPEVSPAPARIAQADTQKGDQKTAPRQPAAQTDAEQNGTARQTNSSEKGSGSWLEEIQSEGYRNLTVDQLISLKIHGVSGEYIRQMREAGFQLTADQMVSFRIHGITSEFVRQLQQAGFQNPRPDDVISLKIHGADPAWIRQIQSLGLSGLSIDRIVELRIHGITPEFIQEARKRFPNITLDQLIQLKQLGIL